MKKRDQPYGGKLSALDTLFGKQGSEDIAIDRIVLPPQQPRRYFDSQALERLSTSIRENGVLQPLLLRPLPDETFELVAGERRLRAAKAAGLTTVPAVVRDLSDDVSRELALVENLLREDLNPLEATEGVLDLLALKLATNRNEVISLLTQMKYARNKKHNVMPDPEKHNVMPDEHEAVEAVFNSFGMTWYSFVQNRLPLLRLPHDILEALRMGRVEYTKATALARIQDEGVRTDFLAKAVAGKVSLSDIREANSRKAESPTDLLSIVKRRLSPRHYRRLDATTQKQVGKLLKELEKLLAEK